MKIASAEAIPIRIPLKHPFTIALGTLTHSNHVLVRMTNDQGVTGWGECTTFHSVYGYDQRSLYHVLTTYLIPSILGCDPKDMSLLHARMDMAIPFNLMAKCGIDLAAHDLVGRCENSPVHLSAGSRMINSVAVTAAVGIGSPGESAAMAEELVTKGFSTIKVKIGTNPPADLERVKAVRKAIGNSIRLRVDANQGYDLQTALKILEQMEPYVLEWIEQPLPYWDLEGHAILAQRLETPIALDESVYTVHDVARIAKTKAGDVVNIKLPKCGGIHPSREIARICELHGIKCFLGGCLETTLGTSAQAHFYASTHNIISAAEMEGPWCYVDDVVTAGLDIKDGMALLPVGPGFGIDIDPHKLANYRISL